MPIRSARVPFVRSVARLAPASAAPLASVAPLTTAAALFAAALAAPAHAQCGPRWVHSQAQQYPGVLGGYLEDVNTGTLLVSNDGEAPQYKECLVVGGTFSGVGNVAANGVAYWDGENWFNAGFDLPPDAKVEAVGVDEGSIIYTIRDRDTFDLLIKRFDPWNGQTVVELVIVSQITSIERVAGRLLLLALGTHPLLSSVIQRNAGGAYTSLGQPGVSGGGFPVFVEELDGRIYVFGPSLSGSESNAAVFTDSWAPIPDLYQAYCSDVARWNDELVIAGSVLTMGGPYYSPVAFNGQTWRQLPELPNIGFRLHAGASALLAIGDRDTDQPLALVGDAWVPLPRQPLLRGIAGSRIRETVQFGNDTIFGGSFRARELYNVIVADRIARYNGSEYLPLSYGLDFSIRDSVVIDEVMYAAGAFVMAGGQRANFVASWDGVRWALMGAGLVSQTGGIAIWDGKPVVSGEFPLPGGEAVHRVCSWDGAQWTPIGPDLSNTSSELAVIDGVLYVLGSNLQGDADVLRLVDGQWEPLPDLGPDRAAFSMINFGGALHVGTDNGTVFRLDGSSWLQRGQALGAGRVLDLLEHNGQLLCASGGAVGTTLLTGGVFALSGETWVQYGDPAQIRSALDLHVHEGKLYAAGQSPALNTGGLWVFDQDWQPVHGISSNDRIGYVTSLNSVGPELIASGYFDRVDGRPTGRWARWNAAGKPRFLEQPQSAVTNGEPVTLTVRLAPPYDTEATYRWYFNGQPLPQETSNRPTIEVAGRGDYFCRVTIGCLTAESQVASIAVPTPECPGDTDLNGIVNFLDVTTVLANFGSAALGASVLGDANGDGNVNFLDITVVLANFGTSCP